MFIYYTVNRRVHALVYIDQTWLGVRCHPEWEIRSLLFSCSLTFRGHNQPIDQVTAAASLKYSKKCTCACFFRFGKIEHITHFHPLSSQILSYINIFDINENLLAQATDVKYFVSNL